MSADGRLISHTVRVFDYNVFTFVVIVGVVIIRSLIVKNLRHAILIGFIVVPVKLFDCLVLVEFQI